MYVGITGFGSRDEVDQILSSEKTRKPIMFGVLATEKTLNGINKTNNPNRYPDINMIPNIFPKRSRNTFNLIHYATHNADTLTSQLRTLTGKAGKNLDGIQLNMTWPRIHAIAEYLSSYPDKKIVLQVGPEAMRIIMYSPEKLLEKIQTYEQVIDCVLFDFSAGKGKRLNTDVARRYISLLKDNDIPLEIAIAGGIDHLNVDMVKPIVHEYPDVGIDAESGLRNSRDFLDIPKAQAYLRNYSLMFT
jgi:phosphoribosylanthranilate isomerase